MVQSSDGSDFEELWDLNFIRNFLYLHSKIDRYRTANVNVEVGAYCLKSVFDLANLFLRDL